MNKNIFSDIKAEEVETLEDGKYKGQISDINRDTKTYDYTKYSVLIKDKNITLQLSFPTRITFLNTGKPSSQHAKFLYNMGIMLDKNTNVEDAVFSMIGKEIEFLVTQKETNSGTFSEIVKDSVKLID